MTYMNKTFLLFEIGSKCIECKTIKYYKILQKFHTKATGLVLRYYTTQILIPYHSIESRS